MTSGHQAQEFGLGLGDLCTEEVEEKVNKKREEKKYLSEEDANTVRPGDHGKKQKLTRNPTLEHF